jgi:uncharacterized protein YxjI
MLLDHNKFVVKSQGKMFSSKKSYEILDGETGQSLGTAKDTTGFLASFFGSKTIEVRDAANTPLFSVGRQGWLMKKDQVLDPQGQVIGRYKAKMFSLSGGFHVYDKDGKHLAEIQGKMFKAEYKFVTPDRSTEIGSVSRSERRLPSSRSSRRRPARVAARRVVEEAAEKSERERTARRMINPENRVPKDLATCLRFQRRFR